MSFSLYGALPPSKTGKDSEKPDKPKSTSSAGMGGLYSSLPAPESGSTAFQASHDPSSATTTNAFITTGSQATVMAEAAAAAAATTQPIGWSAFNKFRPVTRRPTIQAKPKLNKPFIPAGATIVSEKIVTKEEKQLELQQQKATEAAATAASKSSIDSGAQLKNDNINLGVIPFLTSADDVNGFRANQKSKKKSKKGKLNANNNTQPLPTVFNMMEDYDPHKPNDYEQYKEERRELKEQQRKKRDWERRQNRSRSRSRSYSRSRSRSRSYSRSISHSRSRSRSKSRSRSRSRSRSPYYSRSQSAEPAYRGRRTPPPPACTHQEPPKINVKESAEDAYKRRMMMSQPQQVEPPKQQQSQARNVDVNPAQDIAQKILAKYGWQEGHSLGKDEFGMKEAIEVKPTGRGTGIHVDDSAQVPAPPSGRKENVSPVILLTNMVGPGEVDDMLQEETAEECSRYGKVERCLIFEVPRGKIPDDRAVRIFVKFFDVDSAKRAIQDLNGRFFGGRVVTATYFDKGRFEKLDLAPYREEFY